MSAARPPPPRPYVSGGQVLQSPPLTARIRNFMDETYHFFGLYLTTLLSVDAYAAAENSPFNTRNRHVRRTGGGGGGGGGGSVNWRGSSGGGGGGGGGAGGDGGGRKVGRVDDVRGPECKSCQ